MKSVPGVYDIHSPNVPSVEWIEALLKKAAKRIPAERLWVNPDCGLKTRGWPETRAALANMVQAAQNLRRGVKSKPGGNTTRSFSHYSGVFPAYCVNHSRYQFIPCLRKSSLFPSHEINFVISAIFFYLPLHHILKIT